MSIRVRGKKKNIVLSYFLYVAYFSFVVSSIFVYFGVDGVHSSICLIIPKLSFSHPLIVKCFEVPVNVGLLNHEKFWCSLFFSYFIYPSN